MNKRIPVMACLVGALTLAACSIPEEPGMPAAAVTGDYERGANGGRMLRDAGFALELAIFEAGVPPEFRAWVTLDGAPVDPGAVDLNVTLTRLGARDEIAFVPQGDYLRGSQVVYEPHSFMVEVQAGHRGQVHRWAYDSIEGRTRIEADMAAAFGIETATAGAAPLRTVPEVYGSVVPAPGRTRAVSARFDGLVQTVSVMPGQTVTRGQELATVESNESLRAYQIDAPIAGVVMTRTANPGEQTNGRVLFSIIDTTRVGAERAVFPGDRGQVGPGTAVTVAPATGGTSAEGVISYVSPVARMNQSVTARVELDNADGQWPLGTFLTASVVTDEFEVPLAVRRSGLQPFRDFTVVYAQIGDQYEVRMLELGRQDAEWVEVLGGLPPGTRYVTTNSYILKADVEKSGASHDH